MSDVQAVGADIVTEKSNHQITGMAVSVCITPAAPSPLPIPYPTMGMISEGIVDPAMRTKIDGVPIATVGSCAKVCHGNEAGTLKEVVSLNTGGPSFPLMGAPTVLIELGMAAITGSPCQMNKAITVGAPANATDADGTGGKGGGSGGGDGSGGDPTKPKDPSSSDGSGSGGTSTGSKVDPAKPKMDRYCPKPGTKAPDDNIAAIEGADLRKQADLTKATPRGKAAAIAAMYGEEGGAERGPTGKSKGQAFWSGAGMAAARRDGYVIQEDTGGAQQLDQMAKRGQLPRGAPNWKVEQGEGSGVTNERLWRTISMRSAENSEGNVDAFVAGTAHVGNVFRGVELPVLLHNPKVKQITFRDPRDDKKVPAPIAAIWKRGDDGCWTGPPIENRKCPPHPQYNPKGICRGFRLQEGVGVYDIPDTEPALP